MKVLCTSADNARHTRILVVGMMIPLFDVVSDTRK